MIASKLLELAFAGKHVTLGYWPRDIGDGIADSYVITCREAGGQKYKRVVVPREQVLEAWCRDMNGSVLEQLLLDKLGEL